ncbi:hypothetical protein [Mesonia aestuariivivens]|uniref:Uncharacterized protein n=1 Tax=Mesonia aestuariivivens TaxID=2796128 RepID=A0ABS6W1F3_9FLAO|nr:hypothetical protein [Mesonia aestuariivivens]MBW2961688.1 hypothetical protein [Mesonia aestuariivivens]
MKINILLITSILFFGFVKAQAQNTEATPNNDIEAPVIVIKLYEGKSYQGDGYCLTFKKMIADSRCPKDVTCVWAGEAKALLTLEKNNKLVEEKEVIINNPIQRGDLFMLGEQSFFLYGLMPYPTSKVIKEDVEYYLRFKVSDATSAE